MQPEEPFADASAPASMDAGPPSAAVRRRAVSEATTDQEERLGSRRPIRDEANRDGGTMRRVDSLEKLAPELKANQESFVSSGSDGPKEGSILPHGLEDDDASAGHWAFEQHPSAQTDGCPAPEPGSAAAANGGRQPATGAGPPMLKQTTSSGAPDFGDQTPAPAAGATAPVGALLSPKCCSDFSRVCRVSSRSNLGAAAAEHVMMPDAEPSAATPRASAMAPLVSSDSRESVASLESPSPDQDGFSEYNPQPQDDRLVKTPMGTNGDRVVLVMVGLPARGKTYIARKVQRYLSFFHGAPVEIFNVGEYRRRLGKLKEHDANYFSSDNARASAEREEFATHAMNDMKKFLTEDFSLGRVGIFDGTNTNKARRTWILEQLKDVVPTKHNIIFVESICNDESIISANIRATKLHSPDYANFDEAKAVADFKKRIAHYESVYEPLDDEGGPMRHQGQTNGDEAIAVHSNLSWIKLIDCGRQVVVNRIKGFLQGRIVQFLMNVHTLPRTIYLSRHGQSEYNVLKKIGGNSSLSERGQAYARSLAVWVGENVLKEASPQDTHNSHSLYARLWTSSLNRTKLTAQFIRHDQLPNGWVTMRPREWRALDEIYAGVFDGMSYEEIESRFPAEFALRSADKLTYRYPRGESYLDVMQRLDPIIHELERQTDPLIIIGHQGILRVLYSYLTGKPREQAPSVPIPLHTVVKLTPQVYTCTEERFPLSSTGMPRTLSKAVSVDGASAAPEPDPEPDSEPGELTEQELNAPSC